MIELYLLLIFMIIAAMIAVNAKDLFFSVIAVGAVGLALSVTFVILKAPDIAITQLVMEIIVLIILIRATIRSDTQSAGHIVAASVIAAIFFIIGFLVVAALTIKDLPQFGQPIMKVSKAYLEHGMQQTGATNIVSSVTMDFRNYDTLAEAAVLFASVIGVLTVVRKIGRKKINQEVNPEDE